MAKKDFAFRGKSLEELQRMNLKEFSQLCTARARRSLIKHVDEHFIKKVAKAQESLKAGKYPKPVRTHNRDQVVVPSMIGIPIGVYMGKEFTTIEMKEKMMGHFLGEFALTRKRLQLGKAGIGATRSSTAITARG